MKIVILPLLLALLSWSAPLQLGAGYTVRHAKLTARDLFPTLASDFDIAPISADRYETRIPANTVTAAFASRGIAVDKNVSLPYITVTREDPRMSAIADALAERYRELYDRIDIAGMQITPVTQNFDPALSFIGLSANPDNLRAETGIAEVQLGTRGIVQKKVFFRFSVVTYIPQFRARRNIGIDEPIGLDDVDIDNIRLSQSRAAGLQREKLGSVAAIHYIRAGSPIYDKDVRPTPLIARNAPVTASLESGDVELSFPATAMDSGAAGAVIRVRNAEGRVFRAKVISSRKVLIQ